MAYTVGDHLPESFEELDTLAAQIYAQGKEAARRELIDKIKQVVFVKEFLRAKGLERRANQGSPKIIAINEIIMRFNKALEDGTL